MKVMIIDVIITIVGVLMYSFLLFKTTFLITVYSDKVRLKEKKIIKLVPTFCIFI